MENRRLNLYVAGSIQEAASWKDSMSTLLSSVIQKNPYYESWNLFPAFEYLGDSSVRILFLSKGDHLVGVFPLQEFQSFRGVPLRTIQTWTHPHCFLGTPLVAQGYEEEVFSAVYEWARQENYHLVSFSDCGGEEGWKVPVERWIQGHRHTVLRESYQRAAIRTRLDGEGYLVLSLSRKHRKDYRKKEDKLREIGTLSYEVLTSTENAEQWIQEFLTLEASGWKGKEGTALSCKETDKNFFCEMAKRGIEEGKCSFVKLLLQGAPLAMFCIFQSEYEFFTFKFGFNETYFKFSPGFQLLFYLLGLILPGGKDIFIDSCSDPKSEFLPRVMKDQREVETRIIATSFLGRLVLKGVHLGRTFKHFRNSWKIPKFS